MVLMMNRVMSEDDTRRDVGPVRPLRVFYSYSHRDERLLESLLTHLALLKRQGLVREWHDRKIAAGREWADAIAEHLETADIILLLVSAHFLASDYCYEKEMRLALEKQELGAARVIPIILRYVYWAGAPFGHLQALPKDAKPVVSWRDRDKAWADVVAGIRKAIDEVNRVDGTGASVTPPLPVDPSSSVDDVDPCPALPTEPAGVGASVPPAVDGRSAGTGLDALITLMRIPEVRAAVVDFQADFEVASGQIGILRTYKHLHELFQELENRYNLVYHDARRLPEDRLAWEDLERTEPEIQGIADDLLALAAQAPIAEEEGLWMRRLDRARSQLRTAVETYDVEQLRHAVRRLNEVLAREPTRLNLRLVGVADAVRLTELVDAMTVVRDSLGRVGPVQAAERQLEEFDRGVEALARLDVALTTLVVNHNRLQSIDDELRRVEGVLDQDIGELEYAWQDLRPLMQRLRAGSEEEWTRRLAVMGDELEEALARKDPNKIKQLFRRLRGQETRAFNRVDRELFLLCGELLSVGERLDGVLETLNDE